MREIRERRGRLASGTGSLVGDWPDRQVQREGTAQFELTDVAKQRNNECHCAYLRDHGHKALGGNASDGVHRVEGDQLVSQLEHVKLHSKNESRNTDER